MSMVVEAINSSVGNYERDDGRADCSWHERLVSRHLAQTIEEASDRISNIVQAATKKGWFVFGTRVIGRCDRGHLAYHTYCQETQKPILLCENPPESCPFEIYRFMNWLEREGVK